MGYSFKDRFVNVITNDLEMRESWLSDYISASYQAVDDHWTKSKYE